MKGAAHFTLNPLTKIPFPTGDYSVIRADWSIMDGEGQSNTPLSEVYNHHWLIGTATGVNPLGEWIQEGGPRCFCCSFPTLPSLFYLRAL